MPYSGPDDKTLPERIQKMFPPIKAAWVEAFNDAFGKCQEQEDSPREGGDCESAAMRAANATIKDDAEMSGGFIFFDLEGLTAGKPFPGFAAGEFVDMLGRELELKAEDLKEFIKNTLNKIKEFQARNMPGLPIDARNHDKGDAAGWITGVEAGEVTDSKGTAVPVIRIMAEWTKLGAELIREKIQTNFSPTVDLDGKAIVGGSLTNWPASVDDNGIPLFTAVELARGIHYLQTAVTPNDAPPTWARRLLDSLSELVNGPRLRGDMNANTQAGTTPPDNNLGDEPMTIELTQEQIDALVDKRVKTALAELETQRQKNEPARVDLTQLAEAFGLKTDGAAAAEISHLDQLAEMVQQQANLKWQAKLAQMQRENRYAELAGRVVGGSPDAPRGIPADAEKIKAELMLLEPDRAKFWSDLLETTVKHGLNDYAELGHGRKTANLKPVPDFATADLRSALERGATAEEFFNAIGLGSASEYDLSQYVKGDK